MIYIFIREGGFYQVDLESDQEARLNAELNPGTIQVQDVQGRFVWPKVEPKKFSESIS